MLPGASASSQASQTPSMFSLHRNRHNTEPARVDGRLCPAVQGSSELEADKGPDPTDWSVPSAGGWKLAQGPATTGLCSECGGPELEPSSDRHTEGRAPGAAPGQAPPHARTEHSLHNVSGALPALIARTVVSEAPALQPEAVTARWVADRALARPCPAAWTRLRLRGSWPPGTLRRARTVCAMEPEPGVGVAGHGGEPRHLRPQLTGPLRNGRHGAAPLPRHSRQQSTRDVARVVGSLPERVPPSDRNSDTSQL